MKVSTLFLVLASLGFSQTAPRPAFEAADIHASAKVAYPGMRGPLVRGERYQVKDATLLDLISTAYNLPADRVQGGPAWLNTDRFDILAKVAAGSTSASSKQMLQALLEDRFRLAAHTDTRPLDAYSLTVGRGKPKLKEASGQGAPGCDRKGDNGDEYIEMTCRNETMEMLAQLIRGVEVPAELRTIPVVDSTGLQGAFDFDFKWTSRQQRALGQQAIPLADALDKQLGLKLAPGKTPLEVLVIDSVSQKPADNPPDTAAKLPPPLPATFEVAEIRPSRPDAQTRARFSNGRLDAEGIPLNELIKAAWNIDSDDLIANMPKFTDSAKFDVVAKVSTDPKIAAEVDDDTLLEMVKALLVERFKLATHMEDRQVSTYTLTPAKPKLLKANPNNRSECKEGPGADGKDPRVANPQLNRLFSCFNTTMGQFADMLPARMNGYIRSPVRDETGLTDAYDFTLSFSGTNVLSRLNARGNPDGASEPNGALSLFEAINKQMGLKLELQKRTAQVLVVDHVEEKPVDN